MAFKSTAQKEKFKQLVKDGRMTESQFADWEKDTPQNLPDRLGRSKANAATTKLGKATTKAKGWGK